MTISAISSMTMLSRHTTRRAHSAMLNIPGNGTFRTLRDFPANGLVR